MGVVYTIGHSTHGLGTFLDLLAANGINAIADVRSEPFSSRNPDFNRDLLRESLAAHGLAYVFLGRELGARPRDDAMYEGDRVSYQLLATAPRFLDGLARVREGATKYRLALLCAEGDPLLCHRSLLVARRLSDTGIEVVHIHPDGHLERQEQAMERLMTLHRLPARDVFGGRAELLELAASRQEGRIAFRRGKGTINR